jgi:acetoacetate decarboxylase
MGKPDEDNDDQMGGAEATPTADLPGPRLKAGSRIGHFRIEREIGRGGAGVVYLARDTKLGRHVAIRNSPEQATAMTDKSRSFLMTVLLMSTALALSGHGRDFEGTFLSRTAPPYGAPPYRYEGSRLVTVTFETSAEILRALVPKPLTVDKANVMSVTVGLQKIVEPRPTDYYEAYLSIPVLHGATRGTYLPILYLDKAMQIIGGREIWGFSKVDAEVHFEEADGKIHACVSQDGAALIDVVMTLGPQLPTPENSPRQPVFNMKLIPSVEKDAPPDVMQLTSMTPRNATVTKLCGGAATLALGSTASSPLGKIPVRKITRCVYTESGFILDYGKVVHDYRAEGDAKSGLHRQKR